jgi:hypothetical protein
MAGLRNDSENQMTERKAVTLDIPPNADRGACRSCGEPIAWVITKSGKKMPVELATKESHFARCPAAKEWRKKT